MLPIFFGTWGGERTKPVDAFGLWVLAGGDPGCCAACDLGFEDRLAIAYGTGILGRGQRQMPGRWIQTPPTRMKQRELLVRSTRDNTGNQWASCSGLEPRGLHLPVRGICNPPPSHPRRPGHARSSLVSEPGTGQALGWGLWNGIRVSALEAWPKAGLVWGTLSIPVRKWQGWRRER